MGLHGLDPERDGEMFDYLQEKLDNEWGLGA